MNCITRIVLSASLLLVPLLPLQACSTNPATGRTQLLLLSQEDEIALGAEAAPELVREYGGQVESIEFREYVTGVGMRLAGQVEEEFQDLPWEFFVLDSDVINAFALPGGKVFVSRGLMSFMDNEAQLAAVLGHEIGHVTGRHGNDRVSRAMGAAGIASIAGAVAGDEGWGQIVPLVVGGAGQGYLLAFSRSQESEADNLGIRYMVEAGYDPQGMVQLIQILVDVSQGPRQPEFLSTHPDPNRRLVGAMERIERRYQHTQNNPDYDLYERRFRRQAGPHLPPPAALGSFGSEDAPSLAMHWCGCCRQ